MPTFTGVTEFGQNGVGGLFNAPPPLVLFFFTGAVIVPLSLRPVGTLYLVAALNQGGSIITWEQTVKYPGIFVKTTEVNSGQTSFFVFDCIRPGLSYLLNY